MDGPNEPLAHADRRHRRDRQRRHERPRRARRATMPSPRSSGSPAGSRCELREDGVRRRPTSPRDDLEPPLREAPIALVHLAWLIQPSHDEATLAGRTSRAPAARSLRSSQAGVPALVVASSVGAYSAARRPPSGRRELADPRDPRELVLAPEGRARAPARRARGRAARRCGSCACARRSRRSARPRAASAASSRARSFRPPLLRPGWIPFVPDVPGLTLQLVHADDVGDAYRRAVVSDARGAFNIAGEPCSIRPRSRPPSTPGRCGCPAGVLRGAARAAWLARLQPTSPDLIDLALGAPVLDSARLARSSAGCRPGRRRDAARGRCGNARACRTRRHPRSSRNASADLRSAGGILQPMSELPRTEALPRSEEGSPTRRRGARRGGVRLVRRPRPRARVGRRRAASGAAQVGLPGRGRPAAARLRAAPAHLRERGVAAADGPNGAPAADWPPRDWVSSVPAPLTRPIVVPRLALEAALPRPRRPASPGWPISRRPPSRS